MSGQWPILDVLLDVDWSKPDPMAESFAWIAEQRREREVRAVAVPQQAKERSGDLFAAKPKRRKAG